MVPHTFNIARRSALKLRFDNRSPIYFQDVAMDRGLWITWYDLPDYGRDAYLSWLHETYMPAFLKRPGFLWAAHYASVQKEKTTRSRPAAVKHTDESAVPTGDRYILMFGAEHTNVLGNPVPSALNAGLPDADRKMLAMRIGERVNIMAEAARVDGPEARGYRAGMAPAPCIQLGSFNCAWKDEEEMLAWYPDGCERQVFQPRFGCRRELARAACGRNEIGYGSHRQSDRRCEVR